MKIMSGKKMKDRIMQLKNDLTQGGNYAILPAVIRYDNNLTDSEKLLFCELTALSNKKGYCYASNKYLSGIFNVTVDTVSRRINRLKNKGYLHVEMIRDGKEIKERHIYPLMDVSRGIDANVKRDIDADVDRRIDAKVDRGIDANVDRGIDANVEENILYNSNTLYNNNLNNNKDDGVDVGVVFDSFNELGFGTINGYTAEQIAEWSKTFEPKVIIKAMKLASNNNKRTMSYVNGILKNWKNEGLIKLEDIEAEEKSKELNRQSRSKNVSSGLTDEQREQYSDLGF